MNRSLITDDSASVRDSEDRIAEAVWVACDVGSPQSRCLHSPPTMLCELATRARPCIPSVVAGINRSLIIWDTPGC